MDSAGRSSSFPVQQHKAQAIDALLFGRHEEPHTEDTSVPAWTLGKAIEAIVPCVVQLFTDVPYLLMHFNGARSREAAC